MGATQLLAVQVKTDEAITHSSTNVDGEDRTAVDRPYLIHSSQATPWEEPEVGIHSHLITLLVLTS